MSDPQEPSRGWEPSAALVAGAAVVSALLVLVVARFTRPGIGPDATAYIAVADNLRAGDGISFWLEDPLTTWPPLWPMLIAAASAVTRLRTDIAGLLVNAAAAAGSVVLGWNVARQCLTGRFTRMAILLSLAVSPLLVGLAVLVQTEVMFTLLALAVILVLYRWADDAAPRWLVLAGVLCTIGFYIRYQALYAVPLFGLWVVARTWRSGRGWSKVGTDGAWFAIPATVPPLLWIIRNLSVSDTALGPRFPSNVGPVRNVANALATTVKFLTSLPSVPALPAAALMILLLGVGLTMLWRRSAAELSGEPASGSASGPASGLPGLLGHLTDALTGRVGLLVLFVAGFTALMIVSRSMVGFDDLDIRLLAPCLIPTSILFLRWSELVLFDASGSAPKVGKVVVGGWVGLQVVIVLLLVGPANSALADYGFNSDRAVAASRSPVLEELPDGCVPYTNNAVDLYRSGFKSWLSPRVTEYKSSQRTDDIEELADALADGQLACLVWLDYIEDDEVYSVEQLREHFELTRLGSADGVTTYLIEER